MIDAAVVDKLIEAVSSEDAGSAMGRKAKDCQCDHCQIGRDLLSSNMQTILARNMAMGLISDISGSPAEDIPVIMQAICYTALVAGFALGRSYEQSQQLEAIHAKD